MSHPGERTVVLLAGLFKMEPHELVADTSYPPAKADRLPFVAARYTEVELQLELFANDLAWFERTGHADLAVADQWRARLTQLLTDAHDAGERALLRAAQERLRVI
jgi:hypothetical protein